MNWKQNKILFNYIINKKYFIEKDRETNNILFIKWKNNEMKCKYFLALTVDINNNILWSCDNPFIDQKTKYLSLNIKINLENQTTKFNIDFLNNIKKIIQSNTFVNYEEEKIFFIWCIIGNYKNYKQFYIITEIIYF